MGTIVIIILGVVGFIIGMKLAELIENNTKATTIKIIMIILLLLFVIWNEGGFNKIL